MAVNKEQILKALGTVNDPDLKKDLVTLNMIEKLTVEGNNVSFDVVLTTPACPLKEKIKNDCVSAIKSSVPDVGELNINMTSNVTSFAFKKNATGFLSNVKNTIAVASGKGGVGKSTVAVNLAVSLALDGAKVGLIDADIYGPSIPLMLGINEKPLVRQVDGKVRILPLQKFGIQLMSIGFLVEDNAPVIWRGPMASGAVRQFMTDVDWDDLDYLFFDMPPGTGDIQLTLCQTIPLTGAVIVTTPQEVSLADARKAASMFERVNVPILGIVENMSYFIAPDTNIKYDIFGSGGGEKLAAECNSEFLGSIPIDPRIRVGGDKGIPVVYDIPDSSEASIVTGISRNLAAQISIANSNSATQKLEIILSDDDQ
ncbi:MAG: Mrp/NBP35 family ATP-binding protein [Ignavibacteria bacterium]|nr:Mrp/NBP35 family ATP-binding protein [Ignavibacteria bacterium]